MGFNLFKKKNYNSVTEENFLKGPPSLNLPERPAMPNIPKPKDDLSMDVPMPPKMEKVIVPKVEDNVGINVPLPPIKDTKIELPKMDEELPAFDDVGNSSGTSVPKPPAYFSKMGDVKADMSTDYIPNDSNLSMLRKPIFVEINDYKKLRRTINSIDRDAKKSKDIAMVLNELKAKKDDKLGSWDKQLEKIQRSLIFVDKMLFEEGGPNV